MTDDSSLPFDLPSVQRKKVSAAFDGGLISSDGGLVLLREAERRLRLAETLAGCIRDRRNQAQVVHSLAATLRFRILAIACGGACPRPGEAGPVGGCRGLRRAPRGPSKLASGKAPESGGALCSQPTMSRLENAPSRIEVARVTAALVDLFCPSFPALPAAITLDTDDTCDAVHGHHASHLQQARDLQASGAGAVGLVARGCSVVTGLIPTTIFESRKLRRSFQASWGRTPLDKRADTPSFDWLRGRLAPIRCLAHTAARVAHAGGRHNAQRWTVCRQCAVPEPVGRRRSSR